MYRQTVADWAQKFGVLLAEAERRRTKRIGSRWFVDEAGQVVDVLLREKCDLESAEAFFVQAIKSRAHYPMRSSLTSTGRTFKI